MSLIDTKEQVVMTAMIQVRRDNVILDVPAEQKDYYKGLGYNVIDQTGKVIEETAPTDIAGLQRFYKDAKVTIEELKKEIEALKAENMELKKRPIAAKKPEPIFEEPKEKVAAVSTTSTRRRKSSK